MSLAWAGHLHFLTTAHFMGQSKRCLGMPGENVTFGLPCCTTTFGSKMVIVAPGPAKAHRLPLAAWVWSGFPGFTSHLGFLWGLARAAHPSSSLPSSFAGLGG